MGLKRTGESRGGGELSAGSRLHRQDGGRERWRTATPKTADSTADRTPAAGDQSEDIVFVWVFILILLGRFEFILLLQEVRLVRTASTNMAAVSANTR